MAVRTNKERGSESSPSPIKAKAKKKKVIPKWILPWATMGKFSIAFFWKGEEVSLTLKDKEVKFPKGLNRDEYLTYTAMLKSAGFVDITNAHDPDPPAEEKPKVYEFEFGHPDNAPGLPVKGNFALFVGEKEKQVSLGEIGTVMTSDPLMIIALQTAGFVEMGKREIVQPQKPDPEPIQPELFHEDMSEARRTPAVPEEPEVEGVPMDEDDLLADDESEDEESEDEEPEDEAIAADLEAEGVVVPDDEEPKAAESTEEESK